MMLFRCVQHKVKFAFMKFMVIVLNLGDYIPIHANMHMQRELTRDR